MKAPFIYRSRDRRRKERGITMALVAISMVAIIGMAMIAIDLVTLFLAREEAQRAADAAALTAARIISVSGITGTASTGTDNPYWQSICGSGGIATQAAQAAGGQNSVGSASGSVTVQYAAAGTSGGTASDCSTLTAAFAVNPMVVVTVQRTGLPTFFSRYWGYGGQSVSATATAEAFNPSASDVNNYNGSTAVTPVQPRCVKPWIVPNQDPGNPQGCTGGIAGSCKQFVSLPDGSIVNPGITTTSAAPTAVIGESFTLAADCGPGATCGALPPDNPPQANTAKTGLIGGTPPTTNLEYLPGEAPSTQPVAVPSCSPVSLYGQAVAGCDQSTQYQCGVPIAQGTPPNAVDLSENPGGGTGDTALGLACSLTNQSSVPLAGEDVLLTNAYPFQITVGSANPLKIATGTQVTTSNQIVSLPIYDSSAGALTFSGPNANVAIVGFLQVFINSIDLGGNVTVTVLNVAGCGNGSTVTTNNPVTGSSPVPIRLITPP